MKIAKAMLTGVLVVGTVLLSPAAEAGSLGKAAARGAAKSVARAATQRKWGPIHKFKKPTRLERWTNRPKTDKAKGLKGHSYWIRPERGPKGTKQHIRKELNIDHGLKRREETIFKPGTPYHVRPIRKGQAGQKEVILHRRVPAKELRMQERVRQGQPGTAPRTARSAPR